MELTKQTQQNQEALDWIKGHLIELEFMSSEDKVLFNELKQEFELMCLRIDCNIYLQKGILTWKQ